MSNTWMHALDAYSYPVDLTTYRNRHKYPGFFEMRIQGDRSSTIEFENHYRRAAPTHIAAFLEVVFWKMASQGGRADIQTDRLGESLQRRGVKAENLWSAVQLFVVSQTQDNMRRVRSILGLESRVIAIALTLPALASPDRLPMVDKNVAKWVNKIGCVQFEYTKHKLHKFLMTGTSLQDNDYPSYIAWVAWCKEMANLLSDATRIMWRPRDVEMAIFTAQRNDYTLTKIE